MSDPEIVPTDLPSSDDETRLDGARFAALFAQVQRRLWLLAAGITGDRMAAEDIVQDSAMAAWGKRQEFRIGTSFAAWLGQFVRWQAYNYIRKRDGRRTVASDPRHLDDAQNSAPTGRTADLLRSASGIIPEFQTDFGDEVVRALQRIGDVPRACLLLRTVHELSYFEISELLHIPEGTAMSHVHRTRRSMREMLREHVEPAAAKDDSR